MRFVIDAASLLELVAGGRPVPPGHQLVAPAGVRSQALDLLLGRVARGELTEREALELHDRLTETKIRALNDRVSRRVAWDLARERGWDSVRDAEYVAVARLQADALITADPRLASAAEGIIPVAALADLFQPARAGGEGQVT